MEPQGFWRKLVMRCLLATWALLGLFLRLPGGACASAQFDVLRANELGIVVSGRVFVSKDWLSAASLLEGVLSVQQGRGSYKTVTVLSGGSKDGSLYYREAAAARDRVEITWFIKYAPYKFNEGTQCGSARYEIQIPVSVLRGGTFLAITGSPLETRTVTGVFSGEGGHGGIVVRDVLYLIVETPDGECITIDLNPVGPHNIGLKSMLCENKWRISMEGGHYSLCADMGGVAWGDVREFKVVLMAGHVAYEDVHTTNKRVNPAYLFESKRVDFCRLGCLRADMPLRKYSIHRGHGWIDAAGLEWKREQFGGPERGGYVRGANSIKTYRLDVRDGLYLVNLFFGSKDEDTGPFCIYSDGVCKIKDLGTKKGDFAAKTIYTWSRAGSITVGIGGGPWALRGLSVVPLISTAEDYLFKRSWWVNQKAFEDWFDEIEYHKDLVIETHTSGGPPGIGWAWNASITTLHGSNDNNRAALDTRESMNRRLETIKASGFRVAVINGLHFRYNFVDTWKWGMMLRNTRLAVHECRKMGVKVIDHFDFNRVLYCGYPRLLKALDSDSDCLQRNADPLRVSANFCITSRRFLEDFKRYLVEEQRETDVDGYMIDEFGWIGEGYCFCDRCRRLFYEETGMTLPHDPNFVRRSQDPRWRAFVDWRGRKERELFLELKREISRVRADAAFLRYSSASFSAPSWAGMELNQGLPWGADYIGDEFHGDDIAINWRPLFGRCKVRQGVVASYTNAPTWILARNLKGKTNILYAWAIGRMNRANIWYRAEDPSFSRRLNLWPLQMNDAAARPVSDVGVVLLQSARDSCYRGAQYQREFEGWLQCLADENIQYDVIIDRDLKKERLGRYRAVVLPGVGLVSEEQLAALEWYVVNGGRLILTYACEGLGQKGVNGAEKGLWELVNARCEGSELQGVWLDLREELATGFSRDGPLELKVPVLGCEIMSGGASRVVGVARVMRGGAVGAVPGIIETNLGRGKIYYICGPVVSQSFEPVMATTENKTFLGKRKGSLYPCDIDSRVAKLAKNLLTLGIEHELKTRAVCVENGVVFTVFSVEREAGRDILLHFLDCRIKPELHAGESIKPLEPGKRADTAGDIVVDVKSEKDIGEAFAVSPFHDHKFAVNIERCGNDSVRIIMPGEALDRYSILYLLSGK